MPDQYASSLPLLSVLGTVGHWLYSIVYFTAGEVVFLAAVVALAIAILELSRRSMAHKVRWVIASSVTTIVAVVQAVIATALYYKPPAQIDGPLVPGTGNSFPSHHALLAGIVVWIVWFLYPRWSIPFAILAVVIDFCLVNTQAHWTIDVVASSVFATSAWIVAQWSTEPLQRRYGDRVAVVIAALMHFFRRPDREVLGTDALPRDLQDGLRRLEVRDRELVMELQRLRMALSQGLELGKDPAVQREVEAEAGRMVIVLEEHLRERVAFQREVTASR